MAIPNLITDDDAIAYLGPSLPFDTAALSLCVSAASQGIQRYLSRIVPVTDYQEILLPKVAQWDKTQPDVIALSYLPIQSSDANPVVTLRSGRTTALQINNINTSINQAAYFFLTATGDPELGLQTNTGVTLVAIASGTTTTSAFPFADYPSVQSLADGINALGNGWQATIQGSATIFGPWPSTDLWASQSATVGCLSTGQVQGLDVFQTWLGAAQVDIELGLAYLPQGATAYGQGPGYAWQWPGSTDWDLGSGYYATPVLCKYAAGWSVVPEAIQQACLITVQALITDLQTSSKYQKETLDKWSYELPKVDAKAIPDSARRMLAPYRLPRV